jgi:hypothetical protein
VEYKKVLYCWYWECIVETDVGGVAENVKDREKEFMCVYK